MIRAATLRLAVDPVTFLLFFGTNWAAMPPTHQPTAPYVVLLLDHSMDQHKGGLGLGSQMLGCGLSSSRTQNLIPRASADSSLSLGAKVGISLGAAFLLVVVLAIARAYSVGIIGPRLCRQANT
jgi:hypothetical protein